MKIGYWGFGKESLAYGLQICLESLRLYGYDSQAIPAESVQKEKPDILLFSLYWWEHYYEYIRYLAIAGIDPSSPSPVLIVGGQNITMNPAPLADYFHYAVIGDGERVIVPLVNAIERKTDPSGLPGVWNPKSQNSVIMQNVSTLSICPIVLHINPPQTRIEIARGCKAKCRFCALSHIKPYREVLFQEIEHCIKTATTRQVGIFAPDRSSHSAYPEIVAALKKSGKVDCAADVRLDHIEKLKSVDRVRFGIEGLSERLRHACGKKMNDERLCSLLKILVATPSAKKENHTTCDAYWIVDLPGERPSDWEDMAALFDKMGEVLPPTFVFSAIPNIFNPNPQTGLQWAGIRLWEDHAAHWYRLFHEENRHRYLFVCAPKVPAASPANRVRAQLVLRGSRAAGKLIWNLVCVKKLRPLRVGMDAAVAKSLLSLAETLGMPESFLCGELSTDQPLPWDFIVNPTSSKEALALEWDRYREIAYAA